MPRPQIISISAPQRTGNEEDRTRSGCRQRSHDDQNDDTDHTGDLATRNAFSKLPVAERPW